MAASPPPPPAPRRARRGRPPRRHARRRWRPARGPARPRPGCARRARWSGTAQASPLTVSPDLGRLTAPTSSADRRSPCRGLRDGCARAPPCPVRARSRCRTWWPSGGWRRGRCPGFRPSNSRRAGKRSTSAMPGPRSSAITSTPSVDRAQEDLASSRMLDEVGGGLRGHDRGRARRRLVEPEPLGEQRPRRGGPRRPGSRRRRAREWSVRPSIRSYFQRVTATRVPWPGVESISNSLMRRLAPPSPRPRPVPVV